MKTIKSEKRLHDAYADQMLNLIRRTSKTLSKFYDDMESASEDEQVEIVSSFLGDTIRSIFLEACLYDDKFFKFANKLHKEYLKEEKNVP